MIIVQNDIAGQFFALQYNDAMEYSLQNSLRGFYKEGFINNEGMQSFMNISVKMFHDFKHIHCLHGVCKKLICLK